MNTRRWLLCGIVLLIVVAIACAPDIAAQINRQWLLGSYQDTRTLACEGAVRTENGLRHIFVFQSIFQGWPGENHQDIVVTDSAYRVLEAHASEHESMFVAAAVRIENGRGLLAIRRSIRPGHQEETVSYEYVGGSVREVSRSIVPPEVVIAPDFELRRVPGQSSQKVTPEDEG